MTIDRVQGSVVAMLTEVYGGDATVVWAPSTYPREAASDLIAVRLLSGGAIPSTEGGSIGTYDLPQTATLTVGAVSEGSHLVLEIAGARWIYDVTAGQTSAQVRDALLALINDADGPTIDATAVTSGAASIALTATTAAGLYGQRTAGPLTWTTVTEATCAVQFSHGLFSVEIQAFSRTRSPRSGAAALLQRLVRRFRLPSISAILDDWGVALWGPPSAPIDLTALAGPDWESRSACQFQIATMMVAAESVDYIDAATLTLSAVVDGVPETVTVEAPPEV